TLNTWVAWVVIAIEFGGEIDAPSRDPIPLHDTFDLTLPAFPIPKVCNDCQRVIHLSLHGLGMTGARAGLVRAGDG
ncbi:MAG: hypothetical protein WA778_01450, partial [Pseudolabrys sp.]